MKPILFNTAMVKAIVEGRKTVTRRVVKLPKRIQQQDDGFYTLHADGCVYENQIFNQVKDYLNPPYKVGDILWVRETWCKLWHLDDNVQIIEGTDKYYYAADGYNPTPFNCFPNADGFHGERDRPEWRPSIHMPKQAARIFLKVTGVQVEVLQEIGKSHAYREGCSRCIGLSACGGGCDLCQSNKPIEWFANLWNSTIKKQDIDEFEWDANPWVWVIEFERCEKEAMG